MRITWGLRMCQRDFIDPIDYHINNRRVINRWRVINDYTITFFKSGYKNSSNCIRAHGKILNGVFAAIIALSNEVYPSPIDFRCGRLKEHWFYCVINSIIQR
mmetsp:Transcript_14901/g.20414  ORF Transcript_14901/g.20414 Transcript_14901/m.20414 type:complete len:102 (-) Transcript_14901:200-505(-)